MQEKDIISNRYLAVNERFAQICNNTLFDGRPLILQEKLVSLDRTEAYISSGKTKTSRRESPQASQLYRDILKIYDNRLLILMLGIENQTHITSLMPLRQLLYDALRYQKQREDIARVHRKRKDLKDEEFVSGFSREDRLVPILNLVVYWGTKPWDGPLRLHEILDIKSDLVEYRDKINDYRINLLDVGRMENLEDYHGELKALLGFVKYQADQQALGRFVAQNEALFSHVSQETTHAMAALGNARNLESYIQYEQNKEDMLMYGDVNEAIQGMMNDKRKEGQARGQRQKTHQVARNMYIRGFSAQDAAGLLDEPAERVEAWYQKWDQER